MIKIVTIIGARPQIIKAAGLSRAIKNNFADKITEIIVHTGQHYDAAMSQIFFDELQIPAPNYNLNVGSGSHGKQTASMISGIEEILEKEQPNCIVLYGDTNSTLAGAVAASKIHVPVVHIEAGLRSFNKKMPEEVNRILCDNVSTLLFSPTRAGYDNLVKEGFAIKSGKAVPDADHPQIYHCGDIMYDNSLYFAKVADTKSTILQEHQLLPNNYILSTIHRNNNTDEPARLNALFRAFNRITKTHNIQLVLPLHPRTAKVLESNLDKIVFDELQKNAFIKILAPASFLEMTALEKNAAIIITDSGGVQKEAYFFEKPCIILRPETEWVELVNTGSAIIADADEAKIVAAYDKLADNKSLQFPPLFGDGHAAEFMCKEIYSTFKK